MKFLTIFFCVLVTVTFTQDYLEYCDLYPIEADKCDYYNFDNFKCFPWDITFCETKTVRDLKSYETCDVYFCPVIEYFLFMIMLY